MYYGRIKWFNNEKGYGFISYKNNEDIFIHKDLVEQVEILKKGDLVSFDIIETVRGYQAYNVKVIKNKNLVSIDIL